MTWAVYATIAACALAAMTDHFRGVIPNWLTLPMIAAAPFLHWLTGGGTAALVSVIGLVLVGLMPYLLFRWDGMGGGDVKLFAAIGALNGPANGLEVLMVALIAGFAQALIVLGWRRQLGPVLWRSFQMLLNLIRPRSRRVEVPRAEMTALRLGPAIAVAACLVLLTG